MFGKLFKKKLTWVDKTLSNIEEMMPDIERLSVTSQLVKMSVNHIHESLGSDISFESQYCIFAFEIGAMQHAIRSLCDLSVFDPEGRFTFIIYSIFYNEVKEQRITSDAHWEVLAKEYYRACEDRYKAFRQFGFDSDIEKTSGQLQGHVSREDLVIKLIEQLESGTHVLTKDGAVKSI